ncbi:unnamed protein product [Didymodactylos carnosus]|uniref:Tetratricopeptide repeat protein n=1 Tax=Didymodactylos carnosus TaxID=1234261 RepID=A0A814S2J8_9BILA|nr:unnamed protein product [Didymodactylos carnosus]CAF1140551.1 unnamed protein product [Didymodactylos carnosus]CAF3507617.1 unnamed protein product [Didymodactylos carnosus]CAF3904228.1 unnamed protein product [Didymodactylos carnosus]
MQKATTLKQYEQALEFQNIGPNDLSHLALIYEDVDNIYLYWTNYIKILEYSQAAFNMYEKIYPSNHSSIANISIRLACYEGMLELDKSFDNYQKLLTRYKTYSKHVENSDFLSVHNKIGKLLADKGQFVLAREQFQSAFNHAMEDQNKEEIAENKNIAICYFKQPDFNNSLVYFHRALDIYENSMANTISEAYLYALYCIGQIYKEKKTT